MSTDDELRALRERAYGPSADIHEDPAAIARLRALETALSSRDAAPSAPAAALTEGEVEAQDDERRGDWAADRDPKSDERGRRTGFGDPDGSLPRDAVAATGPDPAAPAGDPEATGERPAVARGLPRRTVWLWAGSLVAALILGATITMASSAIVTDRVAVLPEVDVSEWPTSMFGDAQEGARVFEPFEGIRVLVVPNAWGGPSTETTCLFVVRADADNGSATNEILTTGCGSEAFAPAASFTVTDASPEALRERFPVGTAVRVVVEGGEAQVFARTP